MKKTADQKNRTDKKSAAGATAPQQTSNFTYILRCADGSLYTGWTNDLEKRIAAHNAGTGGKYTRSHRPVTLVYCETFPTKEEAMKREYAIKHLSREEKEALIAERAED